MCNMSKLKDIVLAKVLEAVDPEERNLRLNKVRKAGNRHSEDAVKKWQKYDSTNKSKDLADYGISAHKSTHAKDIIKKFRTKRNDPERKQLSKLSKGSSLAVRKYTKDYASFKESLIEGIIKLINKDRKKGYEIRSAIKKFKPSLTNIAKNIPEVPIADVAKSMHRSNSSNAVETHRRREKHILNQAASRSVKSLKKRLSQTESLVQIILKKLFETDDLDLSYDREEHEKIKAQKDALRHRKFEKKTRVTRRDALGHDLGGYVDKQGKPAKPRAVKTGGKEAIKAKYGTGKIEKPLPYDLKGKPGKGKKLGPNVRGKSVVTSKSTGREEGIASANRSAFDKLVQNLMRKKEQ